MDAALERLHSCHMKGNSADPRPCRPQVHTQAVAAAANPLITPAQRVLLQAKRKSAQQQQQANTTDVPQQQQGPHRLPHELRNTLYRVQQLADSRPEEFQQVMAAHERQQQLRVRRQQQQQQRLRQQQQQQQQPPAPHKPQAGAQSAQMLPQPLQPQPQQQQQQVQPGTTHYPESSGQMQQRQLLQQQLALRQLLLQQQHRKRQLQLQLRREPAVLTALIKHSTSWQRLQQLFHSFTPLFNPIHVSAALTHLAQLQQQRLSPQQLQQAPDGFKQLVQELTAAAVACIPDFGPRQVANSLWAIRGLGAGSSVTHRTRNSFLDAFAGRIQYAAPQHVAVMAAAIADMDWGTSTEWCTLLREAAVVRLPYFRPGELAILVHGMARLDARPSPKWLADVMAQAYEHMHSFSLQELSMVGVSLVRLQCRPQQYWLAAYLHAVHMQLAMQPADAAHAGADTSEQSSGGEGHSAPDQQQHHMPSALGFAAQAAAQNSSSTSSTPATPYVAHTANGPGAPASDPKQKQPVAVQGLVNVLWTLAAWQVVPPRRLQACLWRAVRGQTGELTLQGTATLLWAAAKLQLQLSRPLLQQLLQHSQPLLPKANAADISMLAWGLGTLGVTAPVLQGDAVAAVSPAAASSRAAPGLPTAVQPGARALEQTPASTASADTAAADVSERPRRYSKPLSSRSSRSSSSSSSRPRLSQGSSGSTMGPNQWATQWLSDFMYHSYRVMPTATPADVASLLVGAVRMRLTPGPAWRNMLVVEAAHRLPSMTPVQLTSALTSLGRLRCQPSDSFLEAYCMHSEALLAATATAGAGSAKGAAAQAAAVATRRRRRRPAATSRSCTPAAAAAAAAAEVAARPRASRGCYTPQNLANTLGALARLGYQPPAGWCSSWFAASQALLPQFNGQDFAYTMWALAVLGLQPPQGWMDAYLVQLRGHVHSMTSQQLSAVIWGLARLNHRPGVDWMNRFLDRVAALAPQQPSAGASSSSSSSSGRHASEEASLHGDVSSGSGSSRGGAEAPPSPLQLSGYFGTIILQGLTAWAASCLDLGFDGSSSGSDGGHDRLDSSSSSKFVQQKVQAVAGDGFAGAAMHAPATPAVAAAGPDSIGAESSFSSVLSHAEGGDAGVVGRDGSITFQF